MVTYTNVSQQDFIAKFNAAWEKENQMVPPLDLGVGTFRRPIDQWWLRPRISKGERMKKTKSKSEHASKKRLFK